jgi:hypothetical protein
MDHALPVESALTALGDLLAAAGDEHRVVIVGGAALILSGVIQRSTTDVDILALSDSEQRLQSSEPFPDSLAKAIATVARDLGLAPDWMNSQVAGQWLTGLPPGLGKRIRWRRIGGLHVGLAGRPDLIFLKLYAASDQPEADNRHTRDLLALRPTPDELVDARAWIATQDPTIDHLVQRVAEHVSQRLR